MWLPSEQFSVDSDQSKFAIFRKVSLFNTSKLCYYLSAVSTSFTQALWSCVFAKEIGVLWLSVSFIHIAAGNLSELLLKRSQYANLTPVGGNQLPPIQLNLAISRWFGP